MIVKFKKEITMFVTEEMKRWIQEHQDRFYYIERTEETAMKLKGVDFWISNDLVEEVFEKNQKI